MLAATVPMKEADAGLGADAGAVPAFPPLVWSPAVVLFVLVVAAVPFLRLAYLCAEITGAHDALAMQAAAAPPQRRSVSGRRR